ncbi:MAG: glutamate ligase domain-containing protein, partial [Candidatus Geothermincolia bacterium]
TLVYNVEDPFCREVAAQAVGETIGFGPRLLEGSAVWLREGSIVTGPPLPTLRLLKVEDLLVSGFHNVENVMAAAGASLALGEDPDRIRDAALSFEGLEHRCEPAGEVAGVAFFNDSKATNPHATLHAVKSFKGPFVVIMGGRNKGLDFTELAESLCSILQPDRLRGIVLLGESAGEIEMTIERVCESVVGHLAVAESMDDSIKLALDMSERGGAVLFSPACASFDMFTDYKDRGRAFKAAVARLAGGVDTGGIT